MGTQRWLVSKTDFSEKRSIRSVQHKVPEQRLSHSLTEKREIEESASSLAIKGQKAMMSVNSKAVCFP